MIKKFFFLSLFSEVIKNYTNTSILKNASEKKLVEFQLINIRDYTANKHKQVDDYQYGGGGGMVLMVGPVFNALQACDYQNKHVILLSPRGEKLTQSKVQSLVAKKEDIVFLCGHYEGFDERINNYVNEYLSIGDYVITSGELASLVVVDAIVRLIPGVISSASLTCESFNDFLLDYPVYTKPQEFHNLSVPAVLLSGNHKKIAAYRLKERERITKKYRPDLHRKYLKNKNK